MPRARRVALLAASLLALPLPALALPGPAPAPPAPAVTYPAVPVAERLSPWLAEHLEGLAPTSQVPLRVLVSGRTTADAEAAARRAGLTVQQVWRSTAIVVATGSPAAVRAVVGQPGVTSVEGEQPLELHLSSAHRATRSEEALTTFRTPAGQRVDGTGVTIAVIDSGIDGTHPMFQRGGRTTVVRNLKNVCTVLTLPTETCFRQDPVNDSDTSAAGGHGTHVAGIAGGVEVTTTGGARLRGAAPGASLVGLAVGAGLSILNANAAMQWVVDHQAQPCRPASEQDGPADPACPPIRVTNHSYGPAAATGGNRFDPNSAAVRLQRALIAKGVTVVWAAGNDGGDGSRALTNPPGMDPTGGVLMVGSYNDGGTGTRSGSMSTFSSRGHRDDVTTWPDLAAPGDRITSACRPYLAVCATGLDPQSGPAATDVGTYNTISGTSMAAPYVAGVVAQLVQAAPSLTPAEVELLLENTAHRFHGGTGGYRADDPARNSTTPTSFDKGHGLVDVYAALHRLLGSTATPTPTAGTTAVAAARR